MKSLKLVSTLFLFLSSIFFSSCSENPIEPKVIYLVRHAEKDLADTSNNPALTAAGVERSNQLVNILREANIDEFYSTKYQRNLNTIKPIATANQKEIQIYEWHDWKPLLEEIKKSKQDAFIICGHGDNLLPMITYLGGTLPMEKLGHEEYDNLFKVIVSEDKTVVEVTKY